MGFLTVLRIEISVTNCQVICSGKCSALTLCPRSFRPHSVTQGNLNLKVQLFDAFLTTVSITLIRSNMVFRAIAEFDASGSKTCIELKPGDVITRVHKIDDVIYIGRNERTAETGAFPASYVQAEAGDRAIPLAGSKHTFFRISYY